MPPLIPLLFLSLFLFFSFNTAFSAEEFDDPQTKKLVEVLHTGNNDKKAYSASALSEKGDPQAIPHLIQELNTRNNYLRAYIVKALWDFGEPAVPQLIEAVKSEKTLVRANSADALGKIGNKVAIDPLISLLKDKKRYVRKNAILALGYYDEPKVMKALISAYPNEKNSKNKSSILRRLGGYKNKAVIPVLIEGVQTFGSNRHVFIRRDAATALGELGFLEGVQPLLSALADPDEEIQDVARSGLVKIGQANGEAVPLIIAGLKVEELLIRANAAKALGEIGDPRAVGALIPLLKDIPDEGAGQTVVLNAVNALALLKDKQAVDALLPLLGSLNTPVRLSTVEALGVIGDRKAIPGIIPLVFDFHVMVRTRAITVLGDFGAKDAVSALEKVAQKDKKERLRELAKKTIDIIQQL
ncbi:MAG: HEAT repeat domain-containing protein [Nitrospinota bacterium]